MILPLHVYPHGVKNQSFGVVFSVVVNKIEKIKAAGGKTPSASTCGVVLQVCAPGPALGRPPARSGSPPAAQRRLDEEASPAQPPQGESVCA